MSPVPPLSPTRPLQQTHDYKRKGTATLFAILEVLTGKVSAYVFHPKHINIEFVDFLGRVTDAHPGVELYVSCDNYATHKYQNVMGWLAEDPHVSLHFTRAAVPG